VELPLFPAGAHPPARSAKMLSAARERAAVSESLATFIFVSRSRYQPHCAAAQVALRASPSATSPHTARCAGGSAGPCTSCGASRSCSPSPRTRSPSCSLSSARASPRPRRSPQAHPAPHHASTRISGHFRPRTRLHPPARARQRGPSRPPRSRWRCPHAPPARASAAGPAGRRHEHAGVKVQASSTVGAERAAAQVQSGLTPTRSLPGWAETSMQGPITTPGDDKIASRTPPPPQFPPLQPRALATQTLPEPAARRGEEAGAARASPSAGGRKPVRMAVDVVIGGAEHWKSRGGEI
jgi:hypothetical protein